MENKRRILPMPITDSMKEAYVDYAMSVIVARALPDVRDGFKPVHRRIIYTMFEEHITPDKKFRKSASTVGNVMARYHPHGDSSVYDAMVRFAQPFSMRYPLVWSQGNFGSIDGDGPAAMRYTEAKMARISMEMVRDLGKDTVNWRDNFDGSTQEPEVLPALLPNLLVNGSEGIAVGMATKIPPHNLREVVNGILAYMENPEISVDELMRFIPGPDFPTGAVICGQNGIRDTYEKGRGCIQVRSVYEIEDITSRKQAIVVTEIPYQVNKARLVQNIAAKVNGGIIGGITDLRDESSRKGIRIVIELAQGANVRIVLNNLFKYTELQTNYNAIMLALIENNVPRELSLKEIIGYYVGHRREVVTRRTQYELNKALARLHIVEAVLKSLENIDAVIDTIENSPDTDSARAALMNTYGFDEVQAQAILDMRLQRLTGIEYDKFSAERAELEKAVAYCRRILGDPARLDEEVRGELIQLRDRYSDKRRTEILSAEGEKISTEDIITNEQMVITVSNTGYAKRTPLSLYRAQKRGGRGRGGLKLKKDDSLMQLFTCRARDVLLLFTNKARVYRLRAYELAESGRMAQGVNFVNLLGLEADENVVVVIPLDSALSEGSIVTITKFGYVKRTVLKEFAFVPSRGKRALVLNPGDELAGALYSASSADGLELDEEAMYGDSDSEEDLEAEEAGAGDEGTSEAEDIQDDGSEEESAEEKEASLLLVTRLGKVLRFSEKSVRAQSRNARGVKSINLREGDSITAVCSSTHGSQLFIITENGFGKRTSLRCYSVKGRRGQGVIGISTGEKNGPVAAAMVIRPDDELMISTLKGVTIRFSAENMRTLGRSAMGVKIINIADDDKVVGMTYVVDKYEDDETLPDASAAESITAVGSDEEPETEDADQDAEEQAVENYEEFYENIPEEEVPEENSEYGEDN